MFVFFVSNALPGNFADTFLAMQVPVSPEYVILDDFLAFYPRYTRASTLGIHKFAITRGNMVTIGSSAFV